MPVKLFQRYKLFDYQYCHFSLIIRVMLSDSVLRKLIFAVLH